MVMKDFGVTAICCTPSYFMHLIERAARAGRGPARRCRCAWACSAPSRGPSPCAATSRARAGIKAFDIYGLSEIIGPGVAIECPLPGRPAHLRGPLLSRRSSIRRPASRCPDGAEGELVLTTLSKQAMPMIRYRTRDITALRPGALPLRPHPAAHAAHRPAQRRHVHHPRRQRLPVADREPRCWRWKARCRTTRSSSRASKGLDQMEVQVEVTPEVFSDKIGALEDAARQAGRRARADARACACTIAPGRAAHHPAQRGQGQARHRPEEPADEQP